MPGPEHAAWERSEPGTGPTPVYDDVEDKAIVGGWRVDSPPAAFPEYQDPFLKPVKVIFADIQFESR